VDRVAEWIVAVARQTASPPEALQPELRRLEAEVVPHWREQGLPASLVAALPPTAAVLQHGDLWAENIFVRDEAFTVVDGESARLHGAPPWDLLYSSRVRSHSSTGLSPTRRGSSTSPACGAVSSIRRRRSFGGRALQSRRRTYHRMPSAPSRRSSGSRTRWLSYALLDAARLRRVDDVEGMTRGTVPLTWRMSEQWLADPALGPGWSAWRDL